jgi:putative membrane protein
MSTHLHFALAGGILPVLLVILLVFASVGYLRVWLSLRSESRRPTPVWGACSFFLGLLLVWAACGSPMAAYDHSLLTFHMINHLLLMTIAPALILLGEPLQVFWIGTPPLAKTALRRLFQRAPVRWIGRLGTNPALCWIVSAATLLAWHLPSLFTLGMSSQTWHIVEQFSFFAAGILFWWPVIQPWPSPSAAPRWSLLLYLFLATLPCDILSGFLAFSDRVAYTVYLSAPRMFGFSVLEDQQCAAALMWTCVTFIYLVPAVILCSRLLAPRSSQKHDLQSSQLSGV